MKSTGEPMTPAELLARVRAHGHNVRLRADGQPEIFRFDMSAAPLPSELREELKQNRDAVIRFLRGECCRTCGRVIADGEERELMKSPAHCDKARCPFKVRT